MSFSFNSHTHQLLFAHEYLAAFPQRGRPFSCPELGLRFHGLRDCLCLGKSEQALLPIQAQGQLPFIFRESCPYRANELSLPKTVLKELEACRDSPLPELDEAAPFFPAGHRNFWHWTIENLPRLLALEQSGYSGPYIVALDSPLVRQSLELFGIAPERLLPCTSYRVKRLILPPRLSGFELAHNMPLTDFLRQSILNAVGSLPGEKRVYIRRIGRRKIANEAEILPILDSFGFECMTPEELSLAEQFRYMSNVGCSFMAHGANVTLALLQKPGSGLVELFGNRYISYTNLHAVRLLGLRYHALVDELDPSACPAVDQGARAYLQDGLSADLEPDPLYVRIILENMLG